MKKIVQEYKKIIFSLIKLSLPILGGNISQILISVSDTVVAGRYSTVALGSISVASAIVMTSLIGAIGLLLGISPLIANLRGMNIRSKKYFKLNLVFALFVSVPFFLILELILAYIDVFRLSPEMIEYVKQYIAVCAWTVFPTAIFVAVKEFLQAYEKVVFANVAMLLTVVVNLVLNIVLTFGVNTPVIYFEGMGVLGLSIATLMSKVFSMALILIYCIPLFRTPYQKSKKYVKELLKIGAPISVSIFLEFLGFNLTAVLIGMFSALYAGVHNIILCIANITFMIVLSVSNAASIKIGYYNGKKDILNIKRYSIANIFIMILVCIATFTVLGFWSDEVVSIFSLDKEVIEISKKILKIAMCFLFFDGLQGACTGILKGLKDTKVIMYAMVCGYLFLAIPLGSYLAFCHNIVLEGYWIGLALSLFLISIITSLRVIYNIKKLEKNYNSISS